METNAVSILGPPRTVSDGDINKEIPLQINDQFITDETVLSMPEGQVGDLAIFKKLVDIFEKVITKVFSINNINADAAERPRAYETNDRKAKELERDLQTWAANFREQLQPTQNTPDRIRR